jgi:hypothetical protein
LNFHNHVTKLALTPAAPWSDNGYGLVEQGQHRRPDRAGQRVESVHRVQAADIADSALAITSAFSMAWRRRLNSLMFINR